MDFEGNWTECLFYQGSQLRLRGYPSNKLETFEDALFESGKTSTHKTEKTGTLDLLPCGKRNAEMVEIW